MCTEQNQMQTDKSLISLCRQGKSVSEIVVVMPNETSKSFPASSPDPCLVRPYSDFNCTRSGGAHYLPACGPGRCCKSSGQTPHRDDRNTKSRGLCYPRQICPYAIWGPGPHLWDCMSKGFGDQASLLE